MSSATRSRSRIATAVGSSGSSARNGSATRQSSLARTRGGRLLSRPVRSISQSGCGKLPTSVVGISGSTARGYDPGMLIAGLADAGGAEALRFGDRALTYAQLRDAAAAVAGQVRGRARVAVWATPELETCVAVAGVLAAGVAAVPINPKAGERELGHIVSASRPEAVLAAPGAELPGALADVARLEVDAAARGGDLPEEPPR